MNCISSAANVVRSKRICFFNSGSLFLILLLLTTEIACRPPDESEGNTAIDDDYAGVDNVEWHHVKIINGVMHEDHPIIMYKEDFVNEDYDPNSNSKSNEQTSMNGQKNYKDIGTQRRQQQNNTNIEENRTLKPEKMYFDILPETPIFVEDDTKLDTKQMQADVAYKNQNQNNNKMHVNLKTLKDSDNHNNSNDESTKQLLNKQPKKYRRYRRQTNTEDRNLHKRNPYLRQYYQLRSNYVVSSPVAQQLYYQPVVFQRHPVEGKRQPTPMQFPTRFGGSIVFPTDDDNIDSSIFDTATSAPPLTPAPTSRKPPISIWLDVDPNHADFSGYDLDKETEIPPLAPATTRPPLSTWFDSDPNNADLSAFETATSTTNRPVPTSATPPSRPATTTTTPPPPAQPAASIPPCVWSIINCCNRSANVRYSCFESFGCTGAFWDLNPCADDVRQKAYIYVSDYFDDN